jgi:2-dehydro-3-deoxygluconokinase
VLKRPDLTCRVLAPGTDVVVEAEPVDEVVDTTAAGDSFAAAYLAARLAGAEPTAAARAGHRLAGAVVGHPGAIIPKAAMPSEVMPTQALPTGRSPS